MSIEAQAAELGIPMEVKIDDLTRYDTCDAHMATLVSIEGTRALYKGQCVNQHVYEQTFEIAELQQMARIEGDEIVYGSGKAFKANGLEEY